MRKYWQTPPLIKSGRKQYSLFRIFCDKKTSFWLDGYLLIVEDSWYIDCREIRDTDVGKWKNLVVWKYSRRSIIRTISRYIELKSVPLGLINPFKNVRYNELSIWPTYYPSRWRFALSSVYCIRLTIVA